MTKHESLHQQAEHQAEAAKSRSNRQIKELQSPKTFWANQLRKSTQVANKMADVSKLTIMERIKTIKFQGEKL